MDQVRHHEGMIFFTLLVLLVVAGPLALLLNERPDADARSRHRAWL